jgi:hypothetical protein
MAAVGGLRGAKVARRIVRPTAPTDVAGTGQAAEASGDEAPLWSELKTRRRALAPHGDETADALAEPAPITERPPEILHLANVDTTGFEPGAAPPADQPQDDSDPAESPESVQSAEAARSEPEPEPEPEPAPREEASAPPNAAETAAERIAKADLDALSHVELLERLALSMQRRNHLVTAAIQAMRAEAAAGDTANEAEIVFPGQAARRGAHHAPAVAAPAASGNPELPAFGGPEPQGAEDTEKALRTALAALQRMSGTA